MNCALPDGFDVFSFDSFHLLTDLFVLVHSQKLMPHATHEVLGSAVHHPGNANEHGQGFDVFSSDSFHLLTDLFVLVHSQKLMPHATHEVLGSAVHHPGNASEHGQEFVCSTATANIFVRPTSTKACSFYSTKITK